MLDQLTNFMKSQASILDQAVGQAKFGTVTSVNNQNATARVAIQPSGVLTGWLPVLSQWAGNGWGMACPLNPGDQVFLVPQDGDMEQGVIVGRCFSTKQQPPQVPAGEFWLVHPSGSFLKLLADGSIHINGDLHVAGDIYDRTGALAALRSHYNTHAHRIPPNGMTDLPTPKDT